ncbi:hypothetical protein M378DRAFT_16818 [Amanita muscaria Koide BX008]|uniref:Uncharacterized protein n=1 Tax=Amanita muscaria (strain Koide BX008) TaxID=946122 RepID=A0A0C2WJ74_AMAMK|nr:hypothetical protein M378DRAFT_16818 [Amanita muscaria Koide BX008]
MEGFAIQGIRGAADNYKQRVSAIRGEIQSEILDKLRNEKARMEWKFYWEHVVRRYGVVIEGWPKSIPFKNLSETSSSLPGLEGLLEQWQSGKIYWKKVTDEELAALEDEHKKKIDAGEIIPPDPRRRRADCGKKRRRTANENQRPSHPSKKYKSAQTITSSDDDNETGSVIGGRRLQHSTAETFESTWYIHFYSL